MTKNINNFTEDILVLGICFGFVCLSLFFDKVF